MRSGNRDLFLRQAPFASLIFILLFIVRASAQIGTFTPTGSMAAARNSFTATPLRSGKILIPGGRFGGIRISAELFDPTCGGKFIPTGNPLYVRSDATATLLPNGEVLFAGGYGAGDSVLSEELYDPESGSFSATGRLTSPRSGHQATLLANGNVLITGGSGLATAELYNPATGVFSATGSMTVPRSGHTATLLPSGKVLIAGGGTATAENTSELYDPLNGTFSFEGVMKAPHTRDNANLLPNGKVLIAGDAAELYDPITRTFTLTGPMKKPRSSAVSAPLPDGRVLLVGGDAVGPEVTTELYDPATGTFSYGANLSEARRAPAAALLSNGAVLVAGGFYLQGINLPSRASAEIFSLLPLPAPPPPPACPPAPIFLSSGVTEGAGFQPMISAGSIATIFGANLSNVTGIVGAAGLPLPIRISDVLVFVNGIRAPIFAVANVNGTEQINFQVPWEATGQSSLNVQVYNGGLPSPTVSVPLLPTAPGIFKVGATDAGAILHGESLRIISSSDPAVAGEVVCIYATGLGSVSNNPGTGAAARVSPLSGTPTLPTVSIGGLQAEVQFSGLAPNFVGLYQVNVRIPQNAPSGSLDVVLNMGGRNSNTVKLAVR